MLTKGLGNSRVETIYISEEPHSRGQALFLGSQKMALFNQRNPEYATSAGLSQLDRYYGKQAVPQIILSYDT